MKVVRTITTGHCISEEGNAGVVIILEEERVNLTPEGAMILAKDLFEWSMHAQSWKNKSKDDRKTDWLIITNKPKNNEGKWVEVKQNDK